MMRFHGASRSSGTDRNALARKGGRKGEKTRVRARGAVNSAKRELAYRIDAHETACPECYNREPLNPKPRLPHHPRPRERGAPFSSLKLLVLLFSFVPHRYRADTLPRKRPDQRRKREGKERVREDKREKESTTVHSYNNSFTFLLDRNRTDTLRDAA